MSAMRLRVSLLTTFMLVIGLSTLFFAVALSLLGAFDFVTLAIFVVGFNLVQWLIAPYIVDALYRVKAVSRGERPELYDIVERAS
jgi:Zn-dependent protease with chaperone function